MNEARLFLPIIEALPADPNELVNQHQIDILKQYTDPAIPWDQQSPVLLRPTPFYERNNVQIKVSTGFGNLNLAISAKDFPLDSQILLVPRTHTVGLLPTERFGEKLTYEWLEAYAVKPKERQISAKPVQVWHAKGGEDKRVFDYFAWQSLPEALLCDYLNGIPIPPEELQPVEIKAEGKQYTLLSPNSRWKLRFGAFDRKQIHGPFYIFYQQYTTEEDKEYGPVTYKWVNLYGWNTNNRVETIRGIELVDQEPGQPFERNDYWEGLPKRLIIDYLRNLLPWSQVQDMYIEAWPAGQGGKLTFRSDKGPVIRSSLIIGKPSIFVKGEDKDRGYRYFNHFLVDPATEAPIGERINSYAVYREKGLRRNAISAEGWLGPERQALQDWADGKHRSVKSFLPIRLTVGDARLMVILRKKPVALPDEILKGDRISYIPYLDENGWLHLKLIREQEPLPAQVPEKKAGEEIKEQVVATYRYDEERGNFLRSDLLPWTKERALEVLGGWAITHPDLPLTTAVIVDIGGSHLFHVMVESWGSLPDFRRELGVDVEQFTREQVEELATRWLDSGVHRLKDWFMQLRESDMEGLPDWFKRFLRYQPNFASVGGLGDEADLYAALPESPLRTTVGSVLVQRLGEESLMTRVREELEIRMKEDPQLGAMRAWLTEADFIKAYSYLLCKQLNIENRLEEVVGGLYRSSLQGRLGSIATREDISPPTWMWEKISDIQLSWLKDSTLFSLFNQSLRLRLVNLFAVHRQEGEALLMRWESEAVTSEQTQLVGQLRTHIEQLDKQEDNKFKSEIAYVVDEGDDQTEAQILFFPFPNTRGRQARQALVTTRRVLNFAAYGRGKSGAALWAQEGTGSQRTLILAPADARSNHWRDEILRLYKNDPGVLVIQRTSDIPTEFSKYRYVIISYQALAAAQAFNTWDRIVSLNRAFGTDSVIMDESHSTRLAQSATAKAVYNLFQEIRRDRGSIDIQALSATPIFKGPEDLDVTMTVMYPTDFPNIGDFSRAVLKSQEVLHTYFTLSPSYLRWTEDILGEERPAPVHHRVHVPLSQAQKTFYNQVFDDGSFNSFAKMTVLQATLLDPKLGLYYYRKFKPEAVVPNEQVLKTETPAKYTHLIPTIREKIASGKAKVMVVSPFFTSGITRDFSSEPEEESLIPSNIEEGIFRTLHHLLVEEFGIETVVRIDGKVTPLRRKGQRSPRDLIRERWRHDPEARVALVNLPAMYLGTNYSIPRTKKNEDIEKVILLFLGYPLVYPKYLQMVGRLDRPWSKPVEVIGLEGIEGDLEGGAYEELLDAAMYDLLTVGRIASETSLDGFKPTEKELQLLRSIDARTTFLLRKAGRTVR